MIDLRSDTKTLPTPEMRQAMMDAVVGDDVAREDPTVNRLEELCAEITGKEAGLFVTSGTQGNLVAMMAHTVPGQMIICHEKAHVLVYEQGGLARICGLLVHTLPGKYGALDPCELEAAVPEDEVHKAQAGLVELENTHNNCGGTVLTKEQIDSVAEVAHAHGIPVHIDGARIFNAATALNMSVRDLTASVDSLQFCFSKGLGAPVGSMVVGSEEFIYKARRARKVVGGGMRQAGVIAAACLVALEQGVPRLAEDHANARKIAETLAALPGVCIDLDSVQTNIIFFDVCRPDIDAPLLCDRLAQYAVKASARNATSIRFVTHRDVSAADTETVCAALRDILG
ncbi:MAG: aminotransferase class I/II-fold pyridoxal phosphate-dependent enzyme [Armatimonadetes bacterium]|nr:aminotransferase class I/II-fold pyridoxal phosphate-dependent enzyme [Armatimonadota bacterium]